MFTFFGTIILVYFLWLVVKPWVARYMRRKFQQKVNDMFRQAYGGPTQGFPFGDDYEVQARQAREQQARQRQPHRKVFSREDGEYVEFEEVQVKAEYTTASSSDSSQPDKPDYTPREPQISDAEWEEID